jgi:1,4-dihydroxy-2-naphthoyl-CoA hydrolase
LVEHRQDQQGLLRLMPFAKVLGITLDSAEAAEVRGRLAWSPERCTAGGVLHGGALMALADSLGAVCAFLNLPSGGQTTTVASTTAFMRAVREGEVTAVARPLHAGRTVIVVQTDLRDEAGRLAAQVTQTQAVLAARAAPNPL